MKKVLIFGKFDVVHPGHTSFINQAKQYGQVTSVLESDQAIITLGGNKPFYNEKIRQEKLAPYDIQVFVREKETVQDIIAKLKPDILCFGYDQIWLQENFSLAVEGSKKKVKIKILNPLKENFFKSSRIHNILKDKQARVYLINKPKGVNSFLAVSTLRKVLNIKKVGFAGTLDPLASGLLIVAVAKATKLLDWFHLLPKVYQADIVFGQTSDTYDLEGEVVVNKSAESFKLDYLQSILKKFLGKQVQQAPLYSAKKVKGKKLHQLARQGKEVDLPSTEITIHSLDIVKFKYPNLSLKVSCSAGTYIRSLANDLGKATKQGALLTDLKRTAIGDFFLARAIDLDRVDENSSYLSPEQAIDMINKGLT